jgi:hypothetical protein
VQEKAGSCGFCICQLKMVASARNFTWKPIFILSSGRRGVEKAFSWIFIEGKMSIRGTVYTNKPFAHNLIQQEESKSAHRPI